MVRATGNITVVITGFSVEFFKRVAGTLSAFLSSWVPNKLLGVSPNQVKNFVPDLTL